ncbi:hypothetical protein HPP92_005132 [Vanilla planifolia]|uniref:DNA-(apurinic or apyrimidinic site) endonuclease 2 n=1 Tax=Vanilla planifolia TaxID=51239 RepID=A0A835VEC0_VANPL|nr:hypothetical protein HPP92_005132 [Vanilla planifolia]
MKIVTYNVNGLRQRVIQYGSLLKLLNSLDADIICLQETKLRRQDLSVDVTMADGYEAFISCTRTSSKGRLGYSGVATFCRVNSAFSTREVALPLAAEEGFTGLLESSKSSKRQDSILKDFLNQNTLDVEFEHLTREHLLNVDSEGRCIITDHGHFVLFNLYGPRADDGDDERTSFKFLFFKMLQKRWESLVNSGKRVIVVGDLNIAPASVDRCDAEPGFENNMFRTWLRSMLTECGGLFSDVFRSKHPNRQEAYTCFCPRIGAEEFNYGSRIDHILISGPCLHENHSSEMHSFFKCHVEECDIMIQFLRGSADGKPKWNGGRSIKLEGSDHVPVYMTLNGIPDLPLHSTPPLAVRYVPEVHGWQQSIVSFLKKRHVSDNDYKALPDLSENMSAESGKEVSIQNPVGSTIMKCGKGSESTQFSVDHNCSCLKVFDQRIGKDICAESNKHGDFDTLGSNIHMHKESSVKKIRYTAHSQLTLRSFFQKPNLSSDCNLDKKHVDLCNDEEKQNDFSFGTNSKTIQSSSTDAGGHVCVGIPNLAAHSQDHVDTSSCNFSTTNTHTLALLEWQKIHLKMKTSIPLCKGHREPCVARLVKKEGPNIGRRFYVCARAQGPSSNPEANCGHFEWAGKKSQHKK